MTRLPLTLDERPPSRKNYLPTTTLDQASYGTVTIRARGAVDKGGYSMSRSWVKGSTRQWRRTRAMVLRRDGYTCQLAYPDTWLTQDGQLRRCLVVATHVHHIRGKAAGDDPSNLQASCSACNLRTGDPTKATTDPPPRPMTRW